MATRFRRAVPGGGYQSGSCTTAGQTVTCTPGGALVGPTTDPDERWVLEVDLFADEGGVEIFHTVASPHPEPDPDPGPNTATSSGAIARGIFFDPVGPVSVGEVFDVHGVAITQYAIPAYFVNVSLPPTLEAVSVTIDGQTTPCAPSGGCTGFFGWGLANGSAVSMRLRAVSAGPPSGVGVFITTFGLGVGGGTVVQVIDPSITSEIHPSLEPVAEGVDGVQQTLRGTVSNTGSTDHADVTATIEVPTSMQVDDARWGIADLPCAVDGSTITCDLGQVDAYELVDITVHATPTAPGPATVTMTTATSQAQDDPDPFPDADAVTFEVLDAFVDLGLTPYVSHDPAVEGVNYQVVPTITNHGTVPATGVQLVMTLPDGVAITSNYVGAPAPPDSGGCTRDEQVVTCEVGTIPRGGTARVLVISSVTAGTTGTIETSVTSDLAEPAPDPHTNELSHDLTVLPPRADLRARIIEQPTELVVGQPYTFRHQIRNDDGPSMVPSAVGTFEVPAGWTITSAVWDDFGVDVPCTITGTISTCNTDSIPNHSFQTMEVTVVPDQVATDVEVTATASSPIADDDLSNNELTYALDVVPVEFDLGLTASYAATFPAGTAQYVDLRIDNDGPAAAPDTTLTTTLPPSVQLEEVNTLSSGFTCETVGQTLTCTHPALPVGLATIRLSVRDTALGPVSFTADVTASIAQVPDVQPNSVQVNRTVTATPARVVGKIVNTSGQEVPQTSVWVYRVGESSFVASATTDGFGNYSVSGLAPGQYQVRFLPYAPTLLQHEWYDDVQDRALATVFTANNLGEVFVANGELAPRQLTVIQGRVVDQAGQPVAGVTVGAYQVTDGVAPTKSAVTAADGTYSFTVLDSEYKIRFGPPAGSGLRAEWFDNQPLRASANPVLATGWGQVIVADAELLPL
jgi:hypothetical protein